MKKFFNRAGYMFFESAKLHNFVEDVAGLYPVAIRLQN